MAEEGGIDDGGGDNEAIASVDLRFKQSNVSNGLKLSSVFINVKATSADKPSFVRYFEPQRVDWSALMDSLSRFCKTFESLIRVLMGPRDRF